MTVGNCNGALNSFCSALLFTKKSMKNSFLYLFIFLLLFSVASCKDDDDAIPVLELSSKNADFYKQANSVVIDVKSLPADWTISVDEDGKSWCSAIVVNSGSGVKISVTNSSSKTVRSTNVTINNGRLSEKILVRQLGTDTDILVSPTSFTINASGGEVAFVVTTNLTESELELIYPDWMKKIPVSRAAAMCEVSYKFSVDAYAEGNSRTDKIMIKDKNSDISAAVTVEQRGLNDYTSGDTEGIVDDIKLKVVRGEASSFNSASEKIDMSFDGDMSTMFHSKYGDAGKTPVTLTYYFEENTESLDYFIYYPRTSGVNGNFGKVEVSVLYGDHIDFERQSGESDFDFGQKGLATSFVFSNTIQKPKAVRLIVKSGVSDHASCAEMQFFAKNPQGFDPLTLFTDATCSELKAGIGETEIEACEYPLFKNIAYYMLKDKYPEAFRIDTYRAYQHPDVQAALNKTSQYSLLDNPTGILAKKDEALIVLVGDTYGQNIALRIQDMNSPDGDGFGQSVSYPLKPGINKIVPEKRGLIYVMYHVNDNPADYKNKSVKIHFATGSVNGYFDVAKHTRDQWSTLLNEAVDNYFDVVGKYAHLTFPVANLKNTTSNGKDLIDIFDNIVLQEQLFLGLGKYNNDGGAGTETDNRMFKNRMYFNVMYGQGDYMYSAAYHTAYHLSTMDKLCSVNEMKTNNWGPAHEVGHSNQTRPGLKWLGTTEVTNNICTMHIQRLYNIDSRLETTAPKGTYNNYYEHAMSLAFCNAEAFHAAFGDVFDKLVPFWQLELYMDIVLGRKDFYKDVYEYIRTHEDLGSDGACQIELSYICSKIAGMDLTEFFENWGFLRQGSVTIKDYREGTVVVTGQQVAELKQRIKDLNYATPKHKLQYITDSNLEIYKANVAVTEGRAARSGSKFTMTGWQNVVAYEVCNNVGKVIFVSPQASFTVDTTLPDGFKVYAIAADGTKTQVTF